MKRKKTIDYVNELRFGSDQGKCMLGERLLDFLNWIQDNKEKMGVAQFFGKFHA